MKKYLFLVFCAFLFSAQYLYASEIYDLEKYINLQDQDGKTALHYAAEKGQLETVKLLLENNADVNITDNLNISPLMYAIDKKSEKCREIAKLLIENKADLNVIEKNLGYTALMATSILGNLEAVKLLLENNVDINLKSKEGKTALDYALEEGHTEIANLLKASTKTNDNQNYQNSFNNSNNVQKNLNNSNYSKDSSLIKAVRENNFNMVKILVENGIDINQQNQNGDTALILAAENGFTQIVRFLIQNGAK